MNANISDIQLTAEQDAHNDSSKSIWFVAGLLLSILGVLVAYIYQQEPPASRFIDKSDEYTLLYTDAYKAKLRSIQLRYSLIGFFITGILVVFYLVFMFSLYLRMWDQFNFNNSFEFNDR